MSQLSLVMTESLIGEVISTEDDTVIASFDNPNSPNDFIIREYKKDQFFDGEIPRVGDTITAEVTLYIKS